MDDPPDQQQHRHDGQYQQTGRRPAPVPALGEREQQPCHARGQQHGTEHVQSVRRALRRRRKGDDGGGQGHGGGDRREPEPGVQAEVLREQPGHGVAETDARGGCERQRRHRRPRPLRRQRVTGRGHGQRRQPDPETLERPARDQRAEAQRQSRQHAAHQHRGQAGEDHLPAVRAVAQAPHCRGGDGADQHRHRQRPLRTGQGHVVHGGDRRDQRSAEAADDRDQQAEGDQYRNQRPLPGE
ncbi:hypothetical protein STSP_29400 [Streptomyces jeddahensis]|uniref:Uncharacterized protein n=1 Tax=Streptomyces jeddahensis TaxID=1716141 RepID=A0A177HS87_9ACTN|nr:hypothetical protein STSP_29400 [Streptomyces jeddahensis]